MIIHTIGTVRKLIEKRKEVVQLVKSYLNADSVIIASLQDNQVSIQGRTADTATTVLLLGRVLAVGWESAKQEFPDITLSDYLYQPTSVALSTISKQEEIKEGDV